MIGEVHLSVVFATVNLMTMHGKERKDRILHSISVLVNLKW